MQKEEIKLDLKDRKILAELDRDARQPFSHIARKVKISKELLHYRINRLEKLGVIESYYPIIDNSKLGLLTFRVYLRLQAITPSKRSEIINYLKQQKNVWALALLSGNWDIVLVMGSRKLSIVYDILDAFLAKYKSSISSYNIATYTNIYHFIRDYLLDEKRVAPYKIFGLSQQADYDKTDEQILGILAKNARISLLDISKAIGKTPEAISYRIKQLEKKQIILGYAVSINLEKVGYLWYKADISLTDMKQLNTIIGYCSQHPYITQVNRPLGSSDVEIEVYARNLQHFLSIMDELQNTFHGVIDHYTYFIVTQVFKVTFMPEE